MLFLKNVHPQTFSTPGIKKRVDNINKQQNTSFYDAQNKFLKNRVQSANLHIGNLKVSNFLLDEFEISKYSCKQSALASIIKCTSFTHIKIFFIQFTRFI